MKTFLQFTTFLETWNIDKAIPIILLFSILSLSPLCMQGQNGDPPPPPGEHGKNGNQPPGGGAPVGEGLLILGTLTVVYGAIKVRKYSQTKKKKNISVSLCIAAMFLLFPMLTAAQGDMLDFDGVDGYCSGTGVPWTIGDITVEAWVYHHNLSATKNRYLTYADDVACIRHDGTSAVGQLHFFVKTSDGLKHLRVNDVLESGKWYHVAGTFHNHIMKLYLNGVLIGEQDVGYGLFATYTDFEISHPSQPMHGYLDEVRVWTVERSQQEIRSNMLVELTGSETGLEVYYKLNESSGNIAYDATGSVNLTLNNMDNSDWVTSTIPFTLDFGDAPAPYFVTKSEFGACHIPTGPTLGATRDAESDGAHSTNADGDGADEDGISNWQNLQVGRLDASVTVNVQGGNAYLSAWIDWNGDGSWGGLNEQIVDGLPVSVGNNLLEFDVPANITAKTTYARFRLCSENGLGQTGFAYEGEVEDYEVTITAATGTLVFSQVAHNLYDPDFEVDFLDAGDMDNDGDIDFVIGAHEITDYVNPSMLRNEGNLDFSKISLVYDIEDTRNLVLTDINMDGFQDVIEGRRSPGAIAISEYDGNQGFTTDFFGQFSYSLTVGDLDCDGDKDIFSGLGGVNWFENDGEENFTESTLISQDLSQNDMNFIDWNHDGFLDILGGGGSVYLCMNNGTHQFNVNTLNINHSLHDCLPADFDNDGDYDVLLSDYNTDQLFWFENDGNNSFTSHLLVDNIPESFDLNLADIDGDGYLDILAGDILHNNGDGTFNTLPDFYRSRVSTAVDMDGNGMLDIVQVGDFGLRVFFQGGFDCGDAPLPYSRSMEDKGATHLLNGPSLGNPPDEDLSTQTSAQADGDDNDGNDDEDGVSNWQNLTVGAHDASVDVNIQNGPAVLNAWIDWNGDSYWGGPEEMIAWNLSVSTGTTTLVFDVPDFAVAGVTFARFRVGDYKFSTPLWYGGPGEVEDYMVNIAQKELSSANFGPASSLNNSINFRYNIKVVDLDSDGDMDIIGQDDTSDKIYWMENDGTASFVTHEILLPTVNKAEITVTDFDGDQDRDILYYRTTPSADTELRWAENDGNQNFTEHIIDDDAGGQFYAPAIPVDIDQDGDMDVTGSVNGFGAWYENDGSGNFSRRYLPDNLFNVACAIADLDQDGDIDFISSGAWYEHKENNSFTYHHMWTVHDREVADLNGDGYLDIVGVLNNSHLLVSYNDGNQNFTDEILGPSTCYTFSVVDIDGDGDFDILNGNTGPELWVNDGNGNFTKMVLDNQLNANIESIAAGDMDGDGDLDIVWSDNNDFIGWNRQLNTPGVTTSQVSNIGNSTATCGGIVITNSGFSVSARGVCWNTSGTPDIQDNITTNGSGTGSYTSTLTALLPSTTYFVRAYATNSKGTGYGEEIIFNTPFNPPGYALSFDGVDEYVNLGNESSFDLGNTMTIECWIYPDDLTVRQGLFSTRTENESNSFQLEIGPGNGGTNRIAVTGPSTWVIETADNAISTGEWTHIAYTRSGTGTGTHTLYVNGLSVSLTETAFDYADNTSDKVLASGTSNGQYLDGLMDEVRIWNVVRSQTEIRQNMHRTLNGDETNLVAYYDFDATAGYRLFDMSVNDNDGTLNLIENNDWIETEAVWKRWKGTAKSSDWSTADNWSTTFSGPTSNDLVLIEAAGTQPIVLSDPAAPAQCLGLKIEAGASLNISEGKALTVADSIINEAGTAGLVLNSNSGGTASLIHKSSGANATVERYIPKYDNTAGWHYLSSPVIQQPIQPIFVANPPNPNEDFYKFSEQQYIWINAKDNSENWDPAFEENFVVGRGYNIAYNENVTKLFEGELNTGDFTFDETTTPAITYTESGGIGWNLMGNPYPSGLDWDECERTNIDGSVYVFDGNAGQYLSWNGTVGGLDDGIIPPMNGFFIKASENPTLTIPNAARAHTSTNFLKSKEIIEDLLVMQVEGNGFSDKTYIHFNPEASYGFDHDFDAHKLSGVEAAPQLYTRTGDTKLSINELPYSAEEITIPLSLKVGEDGEYTIAVIQNTFWETVDISLKDLETGIIYNLKTHNSISINQSTNTSSDRFLLLINGATGFEENQPDAGIEIYNYGNQVFINTDEPGMVRVYNLLGQQVVSKNLTGQEDLTLLNMPKGFYMISLKTDTKSKIKKVFIN